MSANKGRASTTGVARWARLLLCAAFVASGMASAQDVYPSRPIRIVVPLPAGGPGDALMRAVAPPLAKALNTTIVIDNRGGAGGSLGTAFVAKAPADGYTLGFASSGTMSINPFIYSKLPYDSRKDFEPISPMASYVNVVLCNPKVPANNMAELISYAKANPGAVTFGSGGLGTSAHLAMETVKHVSGAPFQHVPYRGAAPAITDLIGGSISCMIDTLVTSMPHVKAGKMKALAVTGAKRSPYAPEIPYMAESGLPGFEEASGQLWLGLVAPAGTPKAAVEKVNAALQEVLRGDQALRKLLESQGFDPFPLSTAQYARYLQDDYEKWGRIVKLTGAKAD